MCFMKGNMITILVSLFILCAFASHAKDKEDYTLNFHLMHPAGRSTPGDPSAGFYLDGTYHLHYIWSYYNPLGKGKYCSFIHVTSKDMLNWEWQKTKLQPSFVNHGMFSGTGFITKEGRPAIIYNGQRSGYPTYLTFAKDNKLSEWEVPYKVEVKSKDGKPADLEQKDPDCWLVGDTYYAITGGGGNPPLFKSQDLKNWTLTGKKLLQHNMPDVAKSEDIACANMFKLQDKWMLLCISHGYGCRYYIGDWDGKNEQFVPERHGRMNWKRGDQSIKQGWYADYISPESLETPDGRRVMWAWLAGLYDGTSEGYSMLSIQSLPRELSLADDASLLIKPIREMESLRYDGITKKNLNIPQATKEAKNTLIENLESDAYEIKMTIAKKEVFRTICGFTLFSNGEADSGLPIQFNPVYGGSIFLGELQVPFDVNELANDEDIELCIFVDKYIVEIFINDKQAAVNDYMDYKDFMGFYAFSAGDDMLIKELNIWKVKPTNDGFLKAKKNPIWQPEYWYPK
jgi:beta-fructofuranosidase